jgi:hypothetical protein
MLDKVGKVWLNIVHMSDGSHNNPAAFANTATGRYVVGLAPEPGFNLAYTQPSYGVKEGQIEHSKMRSMMVFSFTCFVGDKQEAYRLLHYQTYSDPVVVANLFQPIFEIPPLSRPQCPQTPVRLSGNWVVYYPLQYCYVTLTAVERVGCGYRFGVTLQELRYLEQRPADLGSISSGQVAVSSQNNVINVRVANNLGLTSGDPLKILGYTSGVYSEDNVSYATTTIPTTIANPPTDTTPVTVATLAGGWKILDTYFGKPLNTLGLMLAGYINTSTAYASSALACSSTNPPTTAVYSPGGVSTAGTTLYASLTFTPLNLPLGHYPFSSTSGGAISNSLDIGGADNILAKNLCGGGGGGGANLEFILDPTTITCANDDLPNVDDITDLRILVADQTDEAWDLFSTFQAEYPTYSATATNSWFAYRNTYESSTAITSAQTVISTEYPYSYSSTPPGSSVGVYNYILGTDEVIFAKNSGGRVSSLVSQYVNSAAAVEDDIFAEANGHRFESAYQQYALCRFQDIYPDSSANDYATLYGELWDSVDITATSTATWWLDIVGFYDDAVVALDALLLTNAYNDFEDFLTATELLNDRLTNLDSGSYGTPHISWTTFPTTPDQVLSQGLIRAARALNKGFLDSSIYPVISADALINQVRIFLRDLYAYTVNSYPIMTGATAQAQSVTYMWLYSIIMEMLDHALFLWP